MMATRCTCKYCGEADGRVLTVVYRGGETLESCTGQRARYLALYGQPSEITWVEAGRGAK